MKKLFNIIIALVIFLVLSLIFLQHLPSSKLKIHFLDIGQGDAILIQTANLQNILIDGGPDQSVLEEFGQLMPFLINQIDLLVLSHPHLDHMGGLIEVLKRYPVKKILITAVNYHSNFYDEFLNEINQQNIPIEIATANRDYDLGNNLYLDIIYPLHSVAGKDFENVNNSSIVAKLIYGDKSILFTGDCELECEEEILTAKSNIKADILKTGHHGSRTSSSLEFLKKVKPQTAIIQSGLNNQFEHPHPETLEKLKKLQIEIRRNDLEGRISLEF